MVDDAVYRSYPPLHQERIIAKEIVFSNCIVLSDTSRPFW